MEEARTEVVDGWKKLPTVKDGQVYAVNAKWVLQAVRARPSYWPRDSSS
ncbi:MAG: hypothetical protein HYU03_07250 [Thaumarchaeota archaeon]|nr:hypothetical protein [Nitrososphaerota archaeon]